jgi:hypothetical protein
MGMAESTTQVGTPISVGGRIIVVVVTVVRVVPTRIEVTSVVVDSILIRISEFKIANDGVIFCSKRTTTPNRKERRR